MPDCEFAEIERRLAETLKKLRKTRDTNQRRSLLMHMRVLLSEAEDLLLEGKTQSR